MKQSVRLMVVVAALASAWGPQALGTEYKRTPDALELTQMTYHGVPLVADFNRESQSDFGSEQRANGICARFGYLHALSFEVEPLNSKTEVYFIDHNGTLRNGYAESVCSDGRRLAKDHACQKPNSVSTVFNRLVCDQPVYRFDGTSYASPSPFPGRSTLQRALDSGLGGDSKVSSDSKSKPSNLGTPVVSDGNAEAELEAGIGQ